MPMGRSPSQTAPYGTHRLWRRFMLLTSSRPMVGKPGAYPASTTSDYTTYGCITWSKTPSSENLRGVLDSVINGMPYF